MTMMETTEIQSGKFSKQSVCSTAESTKQTSEAEKRTLSTNY